MTICINCVHQAKYVHKVTPNPRTDTYYCPTHLPRFLYPQMKAGLLNIPVEVPAPVEVVEEVVVKKKKTVVTPDVVVETPVEPEAAIVE